MSTPDFADFSGFGPAADRMGDSVACLRYTGPMAEDRRRAPAEVGSILQGILGRIDPENRIGLWRKWDAVVGEPIASHARPNRLEDGVLVVDVSSHSWAQELQHLKGDLVTRLNGAFGERKIREIYFVVGSDRSSDEPARDNAGPRRKPRG